MPTVNYILISPVFTLQLSFDDIVKFSGAYGEGDSALEALQVRLTVHVSLSDHTASTDKK